MKHKLIFIFILFLVTEYLLRTFINQYKYHEVGLFMVFLPLLTASLVSTNFAGKKNLY